MANDSFAEWVNEEIGNRDWSYARLAREAGLSSPTISDVISGKKGPGLAFCRGVAGAFNVPVESVLRRAGLIPSGSEERRV